MDILLILLEALIYFAIIAGQVFVANTLYRYWEFLLIKKKRNYIALFIGGFFAIIANYMIFH